MATLEATDCPHCGADDHRPWGREAGFTAVKCRWCGLVYVNPRPSADAITEANKLGVHATEAGALTITARRDAGKVGRYRRLFERMFAGEIAQSRPLRWLDVGAGYGEVVEAALAVLPAGSEALGIEPMRPKVEVARARGLAVTDTPLEQVPGTFDVVSLVNVYSHIPDFRPFLATLAGKLNAGGRFFIETGNAAEIERADYPDILYLPDHLVFGGRRHFEDMFGQLGYRIDSVEARRIDGAAFAIRAALKNARLGRLSLRLPYSSPFRTLYMKARDVSRHTSHRNPTGR